MLNYFWVAASVLAVLLVFALLLARRRYPEYTLAQLVMWYTARVLVRVLWRAKQPQEWPVPRGQGAIVICNHRSSVDPFFIQTIADRPIRWMVAREYCQHRVMGIFLRICNVIPVGRGGIDTAATKIAIRCASQGGMVGMLPEGRINVTDQFMLAVRPGAIMVALRARVPILPCYIEGSPYAGTVTSPFLMRARVRVVLGPLFDLSPYYGRESEPGLQRELTVQVVQQIAKLAGRDDFQPKLAGREWKPREGELAEPAQEPLTDE